MYVTELYAHTKGLPWQVIIRCTTGSSTSHYEPYYINVYMETPESTWSASDQRRMHVRVWAYSRQIDVILGNPDRDTHKKEPMRMLLAKWKKVQTQETDFSLFVLSVDGTIGKEALVVPANLSQLMEARMEEPILHVLCLVNGQIAIAFMRLYCSMILVACLPSLLWEKNPDWELSLGLGLAE